MNLIKLNPLKKLMLLVLSWFVHAVYHVEVHAWHIGTHSDGLANNDDFYRAPYGDFYYSHCAGGHEDDDSVYYIFPPKASLGGVFYAYHPGTKTYGNVGGGGVLCLTYSEFSAMQSFFGNAGKNWGKCMAINCCDGQRVSCAVAATCSGVLVSGQMFPVLLASNSYLNGGDGFSTAYSQAYAQARVQIPNSGGDYTQSCTLKPGGYVADATTTPPYSSDSSTVMSFAKSVFKSCPAGYYCPGGANIGAGMGSRWLNVGRAACPAGNSCPAGASEYESCARGYYAYSMASSCTQCPAYGGVYGTTASMGTSLVSSCYISSGVTMTNNGHSFAFLSNCYYAS